MDPDDEVCYCYHVSLRKLVNFAKRTQPERASQMTDCLGAGTGCGWCIPFLRKIAQNPDALTFDDVTPDSYAAKREQYIQTQPKNTFDGANTGPRDD